VYGLSALMYAMSVETLEDLVSAELAVDATAEFLRTPGLVAPSFLNANESLPIGFVVLDGRGGGVLLPLCCEDWDGSRLWPVTSPISAPDGLNPSEIPIAAKAYSSSSWSCIDSRVDALLSTPVECRSVPAMVFQVSAMLGRSLAIRPSDAVTFKSYSSMS